MPINVVFEMRRGGIAVDSLTMQFSDVHALNKHIREQSYYEFWHETEVFMWQDLPSLLVMDLEDDKFAIKGMDWQLGKSNSSNLTYHLVGV